MSKLESVQEYYWNLDEKCFSHKSNCSETFMLKDNSLEFILKLIKITDLSKPRVKSGSILRICVLKKVGKVFGIFKFQFLSVETIYPFNNLTVGEYDVSTYYYQELAKTNVYGLLATWHEDKKITMERGHSKACEIMRRLLRNDDFKDEVIGTEDGSRFAVHRCILAARSPVFRVLLKTDMREAQTSSIEIRDFSSETVENVIKYMYAEDLPEMNMDLTAEVLSAAVKYDITDMKQDCLDRILQQLNATNALDLLLIMDRYHADVEKNYVLRYISKYKLLFNKPNTFDCLKGNPKLLTELLNVIINN